MLIKKMLHAYKRRFFYCGLIVVAIIILLHPKKNALRTYDYLEKENILLNLYDKTAQNFTSTALVDCDYHDIIYDNTTMSISVMDGDLIEGYRIRDGGEFAPSDCKPKFSSAIIVSYRDRPEQLRGFLVYMHMFLRRQNIHYRIYVIEQIDTKLFNRAKLLNIGAVAAIKAGFPCLVLHDVDLLPLKPANLYACTKYPRHMSSSIDKFRFVLPYLTLVGGAIAITSQQFKSINGMSNLYYGWGGEDDDFYLRFQVEGLKLCRFEPGTSQYHMLYHKKELRGERRHKLLEETVNRMYQDGLNSLKYTEVATVFHPLFTHIMVDL